MFMFMSHGDCQLRCHSWQYQAMNLNVCFVMFDSVMQALEWLHAGGRAHCDIKPANIRLAVDDKSGAITELTLVDFGSSVKFTGKL